MSTVESFILEVKSEEELTELEREDSVVKRRTIYRDDGYGYGDHFLWHGHKVFLVFCTGSNSV